MKTVSRVQIVNDYRRTDKPYTKQKGWAAQIMRIIDQNEFWRTGQSAFSLDEIVTELEWLNFDGEVDSKYRLERKKI